MQNLLIDVINLLPDEIECYIQSPSLEDEVVLSLMKPTNYEYYKSIKIDNLTKETLISRIRDYSVDEYFQSIEIRLNNKLLFEGYDGVEFGVLSNLIKLPEGFIQKYIKTGICKISDKW